MHAAHATVLCVARVICLYQSALFAALHPRVCGMAPRKGAFVIIIKIGT